MTKIYELNPVYNALHEILGENIDKDICWKIAQLYQSELEKKVSIEDEEYLRAARFRDESKDLTRKIIGLLEERYLRVPSNPAKNRR